MKKLITALIFSVMLAFALSICVLGAEYTVSSEAELNAAVSAINDSSENATITIGGALKGSSSYITFTSEKAKTITINLISDIAIDDALLVTGYAHVIVNLNGYTYTCTRTSSGNTGSCFSTDSANAKITVNGADADGNFGKIISSDVTYYVKAGTCEHFDADVETKSEETFYTGSKDGLCVIRADGGVFKASKIIYFNNICIGSYFKNCELESTSNKSIFMDSYSGDKGWDLVFENVKFNGHSIDSRTGKCNIVIKDARDEFTIDRVSLGNDSGGNQKLYIITSPTCQKEGQQIYIQKGDAASTTTVLPKSAHKIGAMTGVKYPNGFDALGVYYHECSDCAQSAPLDSATAPAIFIAKGYTSNSDGTGFGTGFQINKDALVDYQEMNDTEIVFGIVVFNPRYLGESLFVDGKIDASKGAIQVDMGTDYQHCNLLVSGFNSSHADLELVFAGYAYESDDITNIQLMQKEYISTEENPVKSPMCSQIKGLYTVKLSTVINHTAVGNKESLDEFVKQA